MKILSIANERRAAQLAADALRGIAPSFTLTWAQTLSSALHWVQGNRDAAAIIVEAEVQGQGCASFVEHVRGLGLTTPVVVVAPEHLRAPFTALMAGADDYVVDGQSLQVDLPRVVTSALQRARAAAPTTTTPGVSGPITRDVEPDREDAASRERLERQLREALATADEAQRTFDAATEQFREMESRLRSTLAHERTSREMAEAKLAAAESTRQEAEQRSAAEQVAAAARLTEVQAEHDTALARVGRVCTSLQTRLLDLEAALREAEQGRASEAAASIDHLARRHAEFTESLTHAARSRDALAQQLSAAMTALDEARQARTAEAAAAAEHLTRREAELGDMLADAVTARIASEQKLAHATRALEQAEARARAEREAAEQVAAGRQAELEERLAREVGARTTLERRLADAEAAQRNADRRHASELATTAARLADVEALHDAAVAQAAAARTALEQRLTETAAALDDAHRKRASDVAAAVERLNQREAELGSDLAEAVRAQGALEHAQAEAERARQHDRQRAAADLAAAAERHAQLEEQLVQDAAARTRLERDLTGVRMESRHARRRLLQVAAAIRRRTRERKAELDAQRDRERGDHQRALEVKAEEIGRLLLDRETLRQSLDATQEQLQRLHDTATDERLTYERARQASESERQRLAAEYDQARQTLAQVRAAFSTLEHVSSEHASERARLESVVADRDAQLSTQAARHLAAEQAARDALEQLQERSRLALDASSRDLAQLRRDLSALRQELEDTRAHAEALRSEADRVPHLQRQLDEGQTEHRRQFERAPCAMCRCNRDGAITHANRSLVKLLGYRTGDELRKLDFAATVFESPDDLRWLIDRSLTTATTESLEATWRTRDGGRLVVRLQALLMTDGSVQIVAEDITNLRAVELRLRQAQRLEAVGRLASEVAVTCDSLLRDVTRDGEQWLAAIESDAPLRHRGELLLGEVTRAAGFLRQFAVYGNKQMSALEPTSVQRVLCDLEPVLKQLAGDDIELVLPKTSAPMEVDVETERVERVLVNVASYARERLPSGGRVKIDLATTVVGRKFVAKYPNVRPGAHVVITVSEVRDGGRSDVPIELPTRPAPADISRSAPPDKPGVDLGALMRLISDCGGHLWMTAEPPGDMTLRIHLPKPVPVDARDPGAPARPRGRSLARLFRH